MTKDQSAKPKNTNLFDGLSRSASMFRILGFIGTVVCLVIFIRRPSFPTADKLLILFTFVAMIFGQAKAMLKRFVPFVLLLLTYESFRGIVPGLNHRVNYLWMPWVDRVIFGTLPTSWLQHYWWHGTAQWYDFAFYFFYMMHFVFPLLLGVAIWQKRDWFYWQYAATYVVLSFSGFITYLLFPAAPPWMASDKGYIEPIHRISSDVWYKLGIHDFPSVYNKIAANPVAAVPSLHAAYATLCALFVFRLFGRTWGLLSMLYPIMIWVGTVYQGEHYAIDAILGIIYALAAYWLVDLIFKRRKIRDPI